jgi:hypothetical protein
MQKVWVVDDALVDGSFSYNIIPKSPEKLLLLEFKWKRVDNGHNCLNKICLLDSFSFFPKSLTQLIQVKKSDNFYSFPLLKQRFPDDEKYYLLTCKGICDMIILLLQLHLMAR